MVLSEVSSLTLPRRMWAGLLLGPFQPLNAMTVGQQGRKSIRTKLRWGARRGGEDGANQISPPESAFSELMHLPPACLQHRLFVHQYYLPRVELPCGCDKARKVNGDSNHLLSSRKYQLSRTHPL